jgi:hypothetical protein
MILSSYLRLVLAIFVLSVSSIVAAAASIQVNNVEELYTAVNDSANVDTDLILAPGTYLLSVNGPGGVPRPNRGRLELQENMSLIGLEGDRGAVVIDAAGLPATSYQGSVIPLGAIRLGRGSNSLEWLTVRNAIGGQGNIVSGLAYSGTPYIRIAHIASTGSLNGLSMFNFGPDFSGKTLELDIIDNDLHTNTLGLRQGFRIGNFAGATGSVINVRLRGNRVFGNQFSLIINNRGVNATINVDSAGNRYYDNGNGLAVLGGYNANGNTIRLEGRGDRYLDNNTGSILDKGGLVIVGGENTTVANASNNNTVIVSLWGCRFSGNELWDLAAIGARANPEVIGDPGTNNHVTLTLAGVGSSPFVEFFANTIPGGATDNTVTVIR